MGKYCSLDTLPKDELLQELVTEDDISETDAFMDDFALSKGVNPSLIIQMPYKVRKLAVNYTYMMVAQNKSLMNQKGIDGADAFELKRKVYAAEVAKLKDEITAEVLLSMSARESSIPTIRILRS